jgi:hypothetical protein
MDFLMARTKLIIGFKDYVVHRTSCCLTGIALKKYKKKDALYRSGVQKMLEELDVRKILKTLRMAEA